LGGGVLLHLEVKEKMLQRSLHLGCLLYSAEIIFISTAGKKEAMKKYWRNLSLTFLFPLR
jgi:hypothetical protein